MWARNAPDLRPLQSLSLLCKDYLVMRAKQIASIAGVFFLIAVICIWSGWNGSAGVNASSAIGDWSISLTGGVKGARAMIGLVGLLLAVIAAFAAIVKAAME
jgi:hypothetical protein